MSGTKIRRGLGWLATAAAFAGCASTPAHPGTSPSERLDRGLVALEEGDYATASGDLLIVREQCRAHPLGDQALLLWAAAELDPRNPDPNLDDVARAAALHLAETGDSSWTRPLAETLYLLALERGAAAPDPAATAAMAGGVATAGAAEQPEGTGEPGETGDAREREDTGTSGEDGEAANAGDLPRDPLTGRDRTAFWCRPVARTAGAPDSASAGAATGVLPGLPGKPLTTRIAELRGRTTELERTTAGLRAIIVELRQELERIRETLRP